MSAASGRRFHKLSGSGNDFLFFDGRDGPLPEADDPGWVQRVCARGTGVGADGVVILEPHTDHDFRIRYWNRDGSRGELCGNASLCAVRLATELGLARPEGCAFLTDAGVVHGRIRDGLPEIDLQPSTGLAPSYGVPLTGGETRAGFADTGVPHLVILTDDLEGVDLAGRGPGLRHDPSLRAGANVNWVAPNPAGGWAMRTFERGVEGETLACGTGACAVGILLSAWGLSGDETVIRTRSGRELTVRLRHLGGDTNPSLRGEGRIVFEGRLRCV